MKRWRQGLAGLAMLGNIVYLAGCTASNTNSAAVPDPTEQRVLLVGFSPNEVVRREFEDRLHEALRRQDVDSIPSHSLLPEFTELTPRAVLMTAAGEQAGLILMVRRVVGEDRHRVTEPETAVDRAYPTLHAFIGSADNRSAEPPPPSRQVVEVYGYQRESDGARLIWSGHSWVDFDGDLARAIDETAEIIAVNMARSRDAVRVDLRGR